MLMAVGGLGESLVGAALNRAHTHYHELSNKRAIPEGTTYVRRRTVQPCHPHVIPRRYTTKPTGRSCIKRTQNERLSSGRYWLDWYQTLSIPVSATMFS